MVLSFTKGQLISEWIFKVTISPKIRTKNCQDFCPHCTGQKSWQIFVHILGETMTLWIHSDIVWPLSKSADLSKPWGRFFSKFVCSQKVRTLRRRKVWIICKEEQFQENRYHSIFQILAATFFFVKMRPAKGLKKFTRSKKAHPSDYVTFLTNYHDAGPNLVRIIFR